MKGYWTKERVRDLAKNMEDFFSKAYEDFAVKETDYIPFLGTFCRKFKIYPDHLRELVNKKDEYGMYVHPELRGAHSTARAIQKEILINGGLTGRFNPTAFIFTAKNIAGMRDVQEQKHEVSGSIGNILARIEASTPPVALPDPVIHEVVVKKMGRPKKVDKPLRLSDILNSD